MHKKLPIILFLILLLSICLMFALKMDHSFNFQYIGYLDAHSNDQYSSVQDYFYFSKTGVLVIKAYSDQISIATKDGFIDISFNNETDTLNTHIILINKNEKVKYNGNVIVK